MAALSNRITSRSLIAVTVASRTLPGETTFARESLPCSATTASLPCSEITRLCNRRSQCKRRPYRGSPCAKTVSPLQDVTGVFPPFTVERNLSRSKGSINPSGLRLGGLCCFIQK